MKLFRRNKKQKEVAENRYIDINHFTPRERECMSSWYSGFLVKDRRKEQPIVISTSFNVELYYKIKQQRGLIKTN